MFHAVSQHLCLGAVLFHAVSQHLCLDAVLVHAVLHHLCLDAVVFHAVPQHLCLDAVFFHAVSQHLCLDTGATDPLALNRLDHQRVLEPTGPHHRSPSLLPAAAVPHPAGPVHPHLPTLQVGVMPFGMVGPVVVLHKLLSFLCVHQLQSVVKDRKHSSEVCNGHVEWLEASLNRVSTRTLQSIRG